MRKNTFTLQALLVAALAAPTGLVHAEDIDLFVGTAATSTNPNVLIVIDNSANWSAANQGWVGAGGESPFKQGQSELRAVRTVVQESDATVNIGLMLFRGGDVDGAYVRYAVRTMDSTNKTNFANLIGDASCVDGLGGNGTPKCIFKNFSTGEQTATSDLDYGAAMFDVFKYFGGCTSPAFAQSGVCKTSPLGRNHFGKARHSGDFPLSSTTARYYDQAAYTDITRNTYIPPAGTANSCAKNYVILIGNGFPKDDVATSPLSNVEGSTTQLPLPKFKTESKTIGQNCGSGASLTAQLNACTSSIPQSLKDANPADSYACVAPILADPNGVCSGGSRLFDVRATKMVEDLGQPWAPPPANKARMADEWARYLSTTDVSDAPGFQNVQVYTINVFKDQQDFDQTALLMGMAKAGGGIYFEARSEEAILEALRRILIDIKAFNSVFASASLPINATNRSQNENQVFIGMFRPDPGARPRWYGNLKRYQIAKFGTDTLGNDVFKLADASSPPQEAVSTTGGRGFIQPCAKSFWTTDTTAFNTSTSPATDISYWNFPTTAGSHGGTCTISTTSPFSDSPDGPQVEKGAAAQVVRLGNLSTTTPDFTEHRTIYTCRNSSGVSCNVMPTAMHSFDNTNVSQAAVGAIDPSEHDRIITFTRGLDVFDDNSRLSTTDVRPSVHGDVAHSRPVPVNYGSPNGVVLYYGANDGAFRAVSGETGKELWAFIAPEHHGKLKRLYENGSSLSGLISYPPTPAPGSQPKDYFFDGSAGLFQNADNSRIWIYPSMRRGGRMLYAFDVTNFFDVTIPTTAPRMKWRVGCSNSALTDTASCINSAGAASSEFAQMGQTWSTPTVARIRGFSTDPNRPVVIVGGGYDTCEDQDAKPNTACTAPGYTRRGNRVYVIDGDTGSRLASFTTDGSVPGDITVVDRDFDGLVDHAYAADTTGGIYRIDFVDPSTLVERAPAAWTITKIAQTNALDARKFLFPPAALPVAGKIYLSIASGDRERPLIINYPYPVVAGAGVMNRAYMLVDSFATTGLPVNLDDTTVMEDFSSGSTCTTPSAEALGKRGWFINLNAASTTGPNTNVGEQGVTSSIIFGGLIFFSTNRPVPTAPGACALDLGEARGYVLNVLNASGAADTLSVCGGARSNTFEGGGLPPSPVTGTVPVDGQPVTVMIGAVQRDGGKSSSIGAQRATPTVTQRRARLYWYNDTDK